MAKVFFTIKFDLGKITREIFTGKNSIDGVNFGMGEFFIEGIWKWRNFGMEEFWKGGILERRNFEMG